MCHLCSRIRQSQFICSNLFVSKLLNNKINWFNRKIKKGKVHGKNGDIKYYCKKIECKKTGRFDGPDDSFLVNYILK